MINVSQKAHLGLACGMFPKHGGRAVNMAFCLETERAWKHAAANPSSGPAADD
jgi:hypothetical protein